MTNYNSICLGLTSNLELNIGSWETIETADESLGVSTPWALVIHALPTHHYSGNNDDYLQEQLQLNDMDNNDRITNIS